MAAERTLDNRVVHMGVLQLAVGILSSSQHCNSNINRCLGLQGSSSSSSSSSSNNILQVRMYNSPVAILASVPRFEADGTGPEDFW